MRRRGVARCSGSTGQRRQYDRAMRSSSGLRCRLGCRDCAPLSHQVPVGWHALGDEPYAAAIARGLDRAKLPIGTRADGWRESNGRWGLDTNLRKFGRRYFFFGPLLAIGGLAAALLVLLPPFLDISASSCGTQLLFPLVDFFGVSVDSCCTAASARSAAAVASVCPTIVSMTPYSLASLALIQ